MHQIGMIVIVALLTNDAPGFVPDISMSPPVQNEFPSNVNDAPP